MHVSERRSLEQYKALIHTKLLSTGRQEYQFSIPNKAGQLNNVEKAAKTVRL